MSRLGRRKVARSGPLSSKEQAPDSTRRRCRGFITIVFDPPYRESGEVRYVASPDINTEDFKAAVDFLSVQDNVDPEKSASSVFVDGVHGVKRRAVIDTRIKVTVSCFHHADMSCGNVKGYFIWKTAGRNSNENEKALNA